MAVNVTSTLTGDQHKMGFDESGTAHLMSILTNMYSDKAMAVVREYSTNASDAHVQAGNYAPIQVFLPNEWDPNFVVQDYGVGLSKDDIISVYAKYGKSTKRETDTQVGSFGIGAKSAFTIASQFVVTGVKDGEKTVTLFSLDSDGIGNVTVLDHTLNSSEPNGVRVSIAVDDAEAIRVAADTLFKTWAPGTVLVDGLEPDSIWVDAFKITDDIYAIAGKTKGITVVMGGVGYPASHNMLYRLDVPNAGDILTRLRYKDLQIIAKIEMGSVDITPSREGLRDTDRTMNVLNAVVKDYIAGLEKAMAAYISDAKSPIDAVVRLYEKRGFYNDLKKGVVWNGITLPYEVQLSTVITPRHARNGKMTASILEPKHCNVFLGYTNLSNYTVITGVTKSNESLRRMIARISFTNDHKYVVAPTNFGNFEWFSWGDNSLIAVMTQDELIAKYKELKPTVARGEQVYETNDEDMTVTELLEVEGDIYYVRQGHNFSSGPLYDEVSKTATIVRLTNRHSVEALEKKIPGIKSIAPVIKVKARAIFDAITEEEKTAISFRANDSANLLVLIAEKLGDINIFGEDLAKYAEVRKLKTKGVDSVALKVYARDLLGESFGRKNFDNVHAEWFRKFPLLENGVRHHWNYSSPDGGRYTWDEKGVQHASMYVKAVLDSEKTTN